MRKWILAALAAVALATSGGDAVAQDETVNTPWAIRIGVLWPTNSDLRDLTDDTWFNAGIDYTINRQGVNEWIGALDYASASGVNAWIFQLIYKWNNPNPENQFSFGVGAAVYNFDPAGGGDQTEYGIPLIGDWAFTERLFLEGKYHWVTSDADLNNLTLQLGIRF